MKEKNKMNPGLSSKKKSSCKWPNLILFISQFTLILNKKGQIDLKIMFMNQYFFRG